MGDDRSKRKPYIVGPAYDWIFFLSPPLLALALGFLVATYHLGAWDLELAGEQFTAAGLALGVFIHAHLVIVFFRSHGNRTILEQFPVRFLVVPAALFVAMIWSPWVAVCASVLAHLRNMYFALKTLKKILTLTLTLTLTSSRSPAVALAPLSTAATPCAMSVDLVTNANPVSASSSWSS